MLPRRESHSSLGVCCAADSASVRGDCEDVTSPCIIEKLEIALGVAAVFL